jgi:hypothetical protein
MKPSFDGQQVSQQQGRAVVDVAKCFLVVLKVRPGNTKGGDQGILKGEVSLSIDLLFDWFGLVCFAKKTKNVSCHIANSKPVKQEVDSTVILPPLVLISWLDGLSSDNFLLAKN